MKTKDQRIETDMRNLLLLPPVAWPEAIDALRKRRDTDHMQSLIRAFDDMAERATFLSEYVSVRGGYTGCGECPHSKAAKFAQRRQVKVTRALGYTPAYRRPFMSSFMPSEPALTPTKAHH